MLKARNRLFRPGFIQLGFVILIISATIGCRGTESSDSSVRTSTATVDSATTGSIAGTVVLDGAAPASRPIDMAAEPVCAKENGLSVMPPQVITGDNNALANVVIYIKAGLSNYRFDTPKDPVVLEQKGCMYEPHVLALMKNQPLEVRNEDSTTHNVHSIPRINRQWNKSQPPGSKPIIQSFPSPENAIPILCNVHPWMHGFAFVFDNPYFEVTSRLGTFDLKRLPPGTYTIEAWQELYGTKDQTVSIGPKESKVISFVFKSTSAVNN